MQRRFFLAFAIVVVSFLGTSPARAEEPEVGSVFPRTEKPFEPAWTIVGFTEVRTAFHDAGRRSITHGIDVARVYGTYVRLGVGLTMPFLAETPEYCRGEALPCMYNYLAVQGFGELHGAPRFSLDPWIRAGIGPSLDVGRSLFFLDYNVEPAMGLILSAAAGLDIHKSGFLGGAYATVATFTTDNLSQVGGGVRLGGEF